MQLVIGVGVDKILQTPASIPTLAKAVDSGRLQLRLRLRSPDSSTRTEIEPLTEPSGGAYPLKVIFTILAACQQGVGRHSLKMPGASKTSTLLSKLVSYQACITSGTLTIFIFLPRK